MSKEEARQVTFADLEQFLSELGFVSCPTAGSHKVFRYQTMGTIITLPGYNDDQNVHPLHLVAVWRTLAENGLIKLDTFDDFVEKSFSAGLRTNHSRHLNR